MLTCLDMTMKYFFFITVTFVDPDLKSSSTSRFVLHLPLWCFPHLWSFQCFKQSTNQCCRVYMKSPCWWWSYNIIINVAPGLRLQLTKQQSPHRKQVVVVDWAKHKAPQETVFFFLNCLHLFYFFSVWFGLGSKTTWLRVGKGHG